MLDNSTTNFFDIYSFGFKLLCQICLCYSIYITRKFISFAKQNIKKTDETSYMSKNTIKQLYYILEKFLKNRNTNMFYNLKYLTLTITFKSENPKKSFINDSTLYEFSKFCLNHGNFTSQIRTYNLSIDSYAC